MEYDIIYLDITTGFRKFPRSGIKEAEWSRESPKPAAQGARAREREDYKGRERERERATVDIGYVIPKSEVIGLELDSHSQISGENERCKMYPSPSFLGLVRALNGYPPLVLSRLPWSRPEILLIMSVPNLISFAQS